MGRPRGGWEEDGGGQARKDGAQRGVASYGSHVVHGERVDLP